MAKSDSRLGKGLGALLGDVLDEQDPSTSNELEIDRISANRFQPRREFEEEAIDELARSIAENGLLQPVVVRRAGAGYELVAGERRLRAVRSLGWERVPATVKELDDDAMLVLALVENIQRENLNPVDEAIAFQQLIDGFGFTQKQVAKRVGRSRSTVANTLRLLTLPDSVRGLVESGKLTAGHARAILSIDGERAQVAFADVVVREGLSVREAERRASSGSRTPRSRPRDTRAASADPVARRAATLLSRSLGTGVDVRMRGAASGEIRIPFHDAEDFERLLRRLLADGAVELFDA